MLLTGPNATPNSVRENKGGPYYWLGLISYSILAESPHRNTKSTSQKVTKN